MLAKTSALNSKHKSSRLSAQRAPFLRVPPFPGARVESFALAAGGPVPDAQRHLAGLVREHRVGGTFWAKRPELPERYWLVRCASALPVVKDRAGDVPVVLWDDGPALGADSNRPLVVRGECDPWHMLAGAEALVTGEGDDCHDIAALLGIEAWRHEPGRDLERASRQSIGDRLAAEGPYADPFTGEPMSAAEAIELCGFWRRLIDSNRGIGAGLGFAFWKQDNVAPLLWGGGEPLRFVRSAAEASGGREVAVWRTRADPAELDALERRGAVLVEVEDGFLRSQGLGADCVPPLSLTVDRLGAYFDPAQPSELELLIERGGHAPEMVERAQRLRRLIVESGLGKYGHGHVALARGGGERRHILVPGQVEDDRSILTGGSGLVSNLELLKRVRSEAPDAYIVYKPHPDVVAGHRRGAISQGDCRGHADEIAGEAPISSLIGLVDEVHVNTSLTGFEALLRDKPVTTYGVPFYAGWGLTRDLGPVPKRRTARPSVDELVAAVLLAYPRYLDPVSGLPCPAEVAVNRLITGSAEAGWVVGLRRLQGRLSRGFRTLVG